MVDDAKYSDMVEGAPVRVWPFRRMGDPVPKLPSFLTSLCKFLLQHRNICVGKKVLAAFNELTPDVVHEQTGNFRRDRLSTDLPGRQQ
jgi:hypothetical protein